MDSVAAAPRSVFPLLPWFLKSKYNGRRVAGQILYGGVEERRENGAGSSHNANFFFLSKTL